MKKILLLLAAVLLLAACHTRYEYHYSLKYTVGDTEYADSGSVTTTNPDHIPIAVVTRTGLEVNTYPKHALYGYRIVYQGVTPPKITEFKYHLYKYYRYNNLAGDYGAVICNQPQKTE